MTLLNAGYWQTTYWAENYWNPKYWSKYGTPVSPPAPTGTGGAMTWQPLRVKEDLAIPEKPTEIIAPQPLTFEQMLTLLSHLKPRIATVDDLKTVLAPFLEAKQIPEETVEHKLRQLLRSFKHGTSSFENGLRKILVKHRVLEKN